MKVKDCMSQNVYCVKPETTIKDVAKLMCQNHIGCIPVCDNTNNICGIITDRDIILRGIACDKDTNKTPISEIMTCNVCTCKETDDMENAEILMSKNQIRRLPVCDNNNKVIGILTLANLTENKKDLGIEEICETIENICDCNNNKNAE